MIKISTAFHLISIVLLVRAISCEENTRLQQDLQILSNIVGSQNTPINQFSGLATNGTQGYYLSPHALGKQYEVQKTLQQIASKISVVKTQYNHSQSTYTMENFVIEMDYNDGRQSIEVADHEEVTVTNGTVFFGYRFNYSVTSSTRNVNGYGHGSVYSDALTYKKRLFVNSEGFLEWSLPVTGGYNPLQIKNRLGIKRIEPYDQNDLSALQQMLDKAFQSISPKNIETQLLQSFNAVFPAALNDSLNHQVLGHAINYTYQHPSKGPLNMNIVHHLWEFAVDKVDGYKIIYVTEIDGHQKQTTCNMTVPSDHSDFKTYGGVQNIHLNCLYQDVVNYMQAQGWLDTALNADWQVNAFQFYAGDLFDMMNSLYTRVNPRSILEGQCKANRNNLVLKSARQHDSNYYSLVIEYNCSVKTTSKTAQTLDILQFIAQTKLYILAYADKLALNFQIGDAEVNSLTFTPVNNFIVSNMNLALFKATQVMKKNLKLKTFGTGFPSLGRQSPKTRVDADSVIYYDASAVGMQFGKESQRQIIM